MPYLTVSRLEVSWWSLQAKIKVSAGLCSFLEAQGKKHYLGHSSSWQNRIPCGYRTKVSKVSLLAEGYSQLLKAAQIPWLMAPSSICKASSGRLNNSHVECLLHVLLSHFSLTTAREDFQLLRTHMMRLGPPGYTRMFFFHLKIHAVGHICKVPFAM